MFLHFSFIFQKAKMFILFSFSSLLFLLFKKEKKKGKTKEKDRLFLSFFFLLLFEKGKEKGKEKSSSPKREMRGKKIRNTRLFSSSSSLFPLLREGKEREASSEKRKWRGKKERKKTLFEKNKVFNFTIFFLFYPSEARIKIFASRRGKRFCRNSNIIPTLKSHRYLACFEVHLRRFCGRK